MHITRFVGAAALCAAIGPTLAYAHELPLGDGKVSASARVGYVFSCQTRFPSSGPGAQASGAWLDEAGKTWDPDLKPIIDGEVSWPSEIAISVKGDKRIITANNLPGHPTGTFPVSRSDDAYQYDRNPNSISEQEVVLTVETNPQLAASPTCVPGGMIGFMLTGAAMFNALDAQGRDAAAHEIQDTCDGHPQQQGQYHYHSWSDCFADTQSGPGGHSDLVGYALDGFGIYGPYETTGEQLGSDDLDACHGHSGPVLWDGQAVSMYHYHFSEDYPYSLGCFMGEVTVSLAQQGPGGPGGPGSPGGPPMGKHRPGMGPPPGM